MDPIYVLQGLYEQLYALTKPLADFLEKEFLFVSNNWKVEYVNKYLRKKSRNDWNSLSEIDIFYLLIILESNWEVLSLHSTDKIKFSRKNEDLVRSCLGIRNKVMHPEKNKYTYEFYKQSSEKLGKFAKFLDPKMPDLPELTEKLHEKHKDELLNLITEQVLQPALDCEVLNSKTKIAVKNTYDRLKVQTTSYGIFAFFQDALSSHDGKEIAAELEKCGLKNFEAIANDVMFKFRK